MFYIIHNPRSQAEKPKENSVTSTLNPPNTSWPVSINKTAIQLEKIEQALKNTEIISLGGWCAPKYQKDLLYKKFSFLGVSPGPVHFFDWIRGQDFSTIVNIINEPNSENQIQKYW